MARIVKEKEYAAKRDDILDVAQRLVYTRGYRQMTIQDILDEIRISKGAFYHYFDSKHALLEALVERMQQEAEQFLVPIVEDSRLPTLEKIQRFFTTIARWKTAQKGFLLALLRVWYADDNALVRQKLTAAGVEWFTPLLAATIRQGVHEGVLTVPNPDRTGEVVLSLLQGFGDALGRLLLSYEPKGGDLRRVDGTVAAYTDALERVLGAPKASLTLIDPETLREWFVPPGDEGRV